MICRAHRAQQHLCFSASFLSQRNEKKKKHIYPYVDLKKKKAWNHQQVTELEFGYWRPEATDYLHFIDKEQRGVSEKQRRCSQVLGSMPYFRIVTFSLAPWLLCDTIPSDWQRWQIHVPVYQNPYFSLSVISQTTFYCDDLTRILRQDHCGWLFIARTEIIIAFIGSLKIPVISNPGRLGIVRGCLLMLISPVFVVWQREWKATN